MNIKALANAVLHRNQSGNYEETLPEKVGNFEETKLVSKFPFVREETRKLFCRACECYPVEPLEVSAMLDPDFDVPGLDNGSITLENLHGFIDSLLARKAVYPIFIPREEKP